MQFRLVKSLTNDAFGRDISGQNVRMLAGTTHLISIVDIEYYQDRTSGAFTWFEFVQDDDIDATISVFHLDDNGAPDGFILPYGQVQLFEEIIPGDSPAILALQAAVTAIQTVNATQTTAINALSSQVVDVPGLVSAVTAIQAVNATQTNNITTVTNGLAAAVAINVAQATAISDIQTVNTGQATSITNIQGTATAHGTAITALQGRATAIETVNTNQNNSITAIQGAITTLTNTQTSQGTAIVALQNAIANLAFNEDQIAATATNKKFSTIDKSHLDTLWAAFVAGTQSATVIGLSTPSVIEGVRLVWSVQLSKVSIGQTFSFELGGTAVVGVNYTLPYILSHGVTISGTSFVVPEGVVEFTVGLDTLDNAIFESTKTLFLTVGGVSGTGEITDNDAPSALIPLTDLAVVEAPWQLMSTSQRTAVASGGAYPLVVAARKNAESPSFGVFTSATETGTYTLELDNQAYSQKAGVVGAIGYDHRQISINNDTNFPTTITAKTPALLVTKDNRTEWMILNSVENYTEAGDTSRVLRNVEPAAYYDQPISIDTDVAAAVFIIGSTPSILPTLRASAAVRWIKIAPKTPDGSFIDLASITPISLTVKNLAAAPDPVRDVKFYFNTSPDKARSFPDIQIGTGDNTYIYFSTSSKVDDTSPSSYFNPSGLLDSGAVIKVDVYDGSTFIRTLTRSGTNPYVEYPRVTRNTDKVRFVTTYKTYSEKGGFKSIPFVWDVIQVANSVNLIMSASASIVGTNLEILLDTDYTSGGSGGVGSERIEVYFRLDGTLLANLNLAGMTFTNGAELLVDYNEGTNFYIQIESLIENFKVIIPYTASGASGKSLSIRAGNETSYRTASISI